MNLIKGEHMMLKIAIVGFGNAGFQAVKAIRQLGKTAEIHVYSDKSLPPSNPMLTTYYVKESIPYDAMFPYGFMKQIQAEYGIVSMQIRLYMPSMVLKGPCYSWMVPGKYLTES